MEATARKHTFRFSVLGRYPARLKGNETAVTVSMAAGDEHGHLVHAGTLTMSESEWAALVAGLRAGLPGAVEIEDPAAPSDR